MSNDEPSATPAAAAKRRGSGVDLDAWKGVWVGIELERGRVHPVSWELLGEGRKLASFDERLRMDIKYIATMRPMGDLKIVLRTVPAVLPRKGA